MSVSKARYALGGVPDYGSDPFRAVFRTSLLPALLLPALLLSLAPVAIGQETGTIHGIIVDERTGEPLQGARVQAEEGGRVRRATTDRQGRFTLREMTPGTTVLRFERQGYVTETDAVEWEVSPLELDVRLSRVAAVLEELLVTAPREPAGHSRLTHAELADATGTVADLLAGRVPGIRFDRDGQFGTAGSRVRIRGRPSFSQSGSPLVYLDGARVESTAMRVLEQIRLAEVRSIEVLRGPDAMSYGLGAGNGVILIRTR